MPIEALSKRFNLNCSDQNTMTVKALSTFFSIASTTLLKILALPAPPLPTLITSSNPNQYGQAFGESGNCSV